MIIDCSIDDCEGEFEVSVYSDAEGDSSIPYGMHTFERWEVDSTTCEHSYDTMLPEQRQAFERALERIA